MLSKRVLILWGLMFIGVPIFAQQLSNLKKKIIWVAGDTTVIDTLAIVPGSVSIVAKDSVNYSIDYRRSIIVWNKIPKNNAVTIEYRVLPFSLNASYNRISYDSIFYRFGATPAKISSERFNARPIDFGKLATAGSIGRSLSFGNRQDAILNSNLNLQMNGYLADSIYLSAAISDNNLPIQPDGSTQNLNEIDQISIQFSKEKWKLQLGDFDIRHQQYFLNFYKRLQGVGFKTIQQIGDHAKNDLFVSGAVARGKFTRNIFQGIEGNQGPYRLKGANQEIFFIVLAGTERVFIDGKMMQRGEDQDYVINYNTAEVTFTPRQMITKDKRIQVEFEYADRNFLNAQLFMNNTLTVNKRFSVSFGYFSNTDARNSSLNQTLGTEQKMFLSNLGDNTKDAFYSTAYADKREEGKILYRKIDTIVDQVQFQSVFIYDAYSANDLYTLSFYDMGQDNGNYILDSTIQLNGKVFKWVAPDVNTGRKRGRYEPNVLLVTPKSQQLYSVSSHWDITAKTKLTTDLALSKYDINLFSNNDKQNDLGSAVKLNVEHKQALSNNNALSLTSNTAVEFTSATFKPVERLRTVEFMRDWGLDFIPIAANEKILNSSLGMGNNDNNLFRYTFSRYERGLAYQGNRHRIDQQFQQQNWLVNNDLSITNFQDQKEIGAFFKPSLDIQKIFSSLSNQSLGFKYSKESSVAKYIFSDSITLASFSFETIQVSTNSDQSKENKWAIKYFTRSDKLPFGKEMKLTDRSHNYNIQYEWMSNPSHQIRTSATFRTLAYEQLQNGKDKEQNLLGRVEYFARYWKGAISGTTLYEVGSGQEPKKTFSYFEVPAGQGEYAWIDFNGDNIQQLNEFEIARFRDQAKFFKIFTPSNEFARTNYLQFNYQLKVDPSIAIQSNTNIAKFLKRLYFQSNFQLNERKYAMFGRSLNPMKSSLLDSTLVGSERISSYSFSFNKFSQVWGVDINLNKSAQLAFLSYGAESRTFQDFTIRSRIIFIRTWTFDLTSKRNILDMVTPAFFNRNYQIISTSIEPRVIYTKSTSWRVATSVKLEKKNNRMTENANIASFITEAKYNLVSNTAINLKLNILNISYEGNANSTIGYIMLDGLKPGSNGVWMIEITKRLSKFIELNLIYEGRKSIGNSVINLGRAQIRAIL